MATGLKNREKYATTVDKKILEKFKKLAENTKIPASKLVDEALEDLIKKYETR